jgi:gelsolin
MPGLRKAKKYDWKDSNMALFGSDVEKNIKKESAETEPAWQGAGSAVGLQIWRIEKFQVKHWPKEEYGNFYDGDSYIVLKTYKPDPNSEKLAHDVHFWIGKYSTQDEYGTAAYKTVELDTFLDDVPVQHRETQNHESSLFKSYFDKIVYMKGGCDTGFRHVEPAKYEPRLLIVKKVGRRVAIKEIDMRMKYLNSGDVFIMDLGMTIYQWNGSHCSKDEKYQAVAHCQVLKGDRGNAEVKMLEQDTTPDNHEFYEKLKIEESDVVTDDDDEADSGDKTKKLFKLSDAAGSLNFDFVAEGTLSKDMLDSNDSFLVDTGSEVIVWVGQNASSAEKKYGLKYAHDFLLSVANRALDPVTVAAEGQHCRALERALA